MTEMLAAQQVNEPKTITVIETRTRHVTVRRHRSPRAVIHATQHPMDECFNREICDKMPSMGLGGQDVQEIDVQFFQLDCRVTAQELECVYEELGLVPDPYAQAAVNEEDVAFADECPNATFFDHHGRIFFFLAFNKLSIGRRVWCGHDFNPWPETWWFAGVSKDLSQIHHA